MKALVASLCLSLFASAAFGQAKFSGQYVGVASPIRFNTNTCTERAIIDLTIDPDGSVHLAAYDFGFYPLSSGTGTITASGKFTMLLDTGFVLTGSASASGHARGSATGNGCKYTFTALRRYKAPYDP